MALIFDGSENQFNESQHQNLQPAKLIDSSHSGSNGLKVATPVEQVTSQFLTENLTLELLYRLSIKFYREKESKAFNVSYNDRTKLFAYNKIVKHGSYKDFVHSQVNGDGVGFFDWIGNDLRDCWEDLGEMSKDEAMSQFILLLSAICPLFSTFVEAQESKIEEEARAQKLETELKAKSESQRKQIQEALNSQTYHQFKAYAQQQYPDDVDQQNGLIKHLQEQHYLQYMQQVYEQQHVANGALINSNGDCATNPHPDSRLESIVRNESDSESSDGGSEPRADTAVAAASIWTRKDIKEFKEFIKKESPESCIKVSYGEIVTVRVPTHEEGTCLFWEFATDDYDIGFGVFFEWTISDTNTVSVHVSESDEDEEDEVSGQKRGDVEVGRPEKDAQTCKPQVDEVLPVYRRDCHEEVYAGSHVYPGRGVYLLKFDNSYSLWRSKRLYYRVYYSK